MFNEILFNFIFSFVFGNVRITENLYFVFSLIKFEIFDSSIFGFGFNFGLEFSKGIFDDKGLISFL